MTEPAAQADLIQIGVTPQAEEVILRLIDRGWFNSEMAAFKAAVAYGLANCIEPTTGGGLQTKWHVGGIDKTGEFLEVVRMFHEFGENDRPWDYIRRVGDASLKAIGPRIEYADVPSDLFVDDESQ
jgi:hypothetical protein